MPHQAPWTPTAQAFAQHQFSHVSNFWKQGRHASFRLELLPGGQAKLNLTFHLPSASEVVPPPNVSAPQQRPIHPLFPNGFPQEFGTNTKDASKKKVSSKQRKSYQRSVLHRATLAAPSLPPPSNGSLRQAALSCVQRLGLQADPALYTPLARKRPLSASPTVPSPSNCSPLAQRIRSDLKIGESEIDSPEKELFRNQISPVNSPLLSSPACTVYSSPAPLVFTPSKMLDGCSASPLATGGTGQKGIKCMNCGDPMGPDHQCEDLSSQRKTVMQNPNRILNLKKFCEVCQKLHPVHKKCQTCVTSAPPL